MKDAFSAKEIRNTPAQLRHAAEKPGKRKYRRDQTARSALAGFLLTVVFYTLLVGCQICSYH